MNMLSIKKLKQGVWLFSAPLLLFACKKTCSGTLMDNVNQEKPMHIEYQWVGCFGGGREVVVITKNRGEYTYELTENGAKVKSGKLSAAAKRQVDQMERVGRTWKSQDRCTTQADYTMQVDGEKLNFHDGDCAFEEYMKLKGQL